MQMLCYLAISRSVVFEVAPVFVMVAHKTDAVENLDGWGRTEISKVTYFVLWRLD